MANDNQNIYTAYKVLIGNNNGHLHLLSQTKTQNMKMRSHLE